MVVDPLLLPFLLYCLFISFLIFILFLLIIINYQGVVSFLLHLVIYLNMIYFYLMLVAVPTTTDQRSFKIPKLLHKKYHIFMGFIGLRPLSCLHLQDSGVRRLAK